MDDKFERRSKKTSKVSKGRKDSKYYSDDDDYYKDKKKERKSTECKDDYVKGRDNKKDDCYYDDKYDKKYKSSSRKSYRDNKDCKKNKHSKSSSWSHSRSCSSDKKKEEDKLIKRWGCGNCVGKHCPHRLQGKHGKWRSGSSSSSDGKGVESTVTVINIAPSSPEQIAPPEDDGIVCVGDTCWKCAGGKCKRTTNPDSECSCKKVCTVDNNGHAKVEITESCKIDRERKI